MLRARSRHGVREAPPPVCIYLPRLAQLAPVLGIYLPCLARLAPVLGIYLPCLARLAPVLVNIPPSPRAIGSCPGKYTSLASCDWLLSW
eukprot:9333552-Pyramimonas_sp.AAC.1